MPTALRTAFVTISAGSFHMNETINQTIPPAASSAGPRGYKLGHVALTIVPMIRIPVAAHLSIESIFIYFFFQCSHSCISFIRSLNAFFILCLTRCLNSFFCVLTIFCSVVFIFYDLSWF